MKYMLLLYGDTDALANVTEEELEAQMAEHEAFSTWMQEQGIAFSGEALHGQDQSRVVRRTSAGVEVTDGPFITLKEDLGGFYVVDVRDADQAIEVAKRCPEQVIEVRPVMDVEG